MDFLTETSGHFLNFLATSMNLQPSVPVQNRFQIKNRLKFRELPLDFQKFFPIEKNFFEKFQNYRTELPKGSFDQKFFTENPKTGQ